MSTIESAGQMVPAGQFPAAMAPVGVPAGGAEPAGSAFTARDAWRVIKQRKLLIIIVAVVLYLLIIAATFLIYRFAPAYTSEAYVQLVPGVMRGSIEEQILPKDIVAHRLATEAAKIKNPTLLQEVLADPEIKSTQFYGWYGDDFPKCLEEFEELLSVAPVRDSYLLRVSIAVKDPAESRTIVNKVVEKYAGTSRAKSSDTSRDRLESLKATRTTVQNELAAIRDRIKQLRDQQDMPALESERSAIGESVAVLQMTISELKARAADVNSQLEGVRGRDPRNLPVSYEMRVVIEADPVLRYYRQQVEALDIQISSAAEHFAGRSSRYLAMLESQRNGYAQKEVARREELLGDMRGRQMESLQQELARIKTMLGDIHEQLIEKENTQRDLDTALVTYTSLTKDEDRLSRELENVSANLRDAENMAAIQQSEGQMQAIPCTVVPLRPSRPNFILYLGGGFVLALLAGVGLAFLREFTDQAIRTPVDVARYGHLSVLGSVPLLDQDQESDVDEIEQATRRAPHALVAESFRQIRAHLTFSGPLESQRVLLITSPLPEDGKTAVAVNLAVTFAQGNQRVLLIDCNFRRPGVAAAFKLNKRVGLSNVLIGHAKLAEAISKTELANLDVLLAGPMPPNPAELLGSPEMRAVLEAARKSYDRVLLDGPPSLLISDALVLATEVDATVLVARAAKGSKGALRRAREQFQRIGARVIGAVLNAVQARAGGYLRQQYREFYEYTSDEVVPAALPGGPPEIDAGPLDDADDRKA